jgi:fucokinase
LEIKDTIIKETLNGLEYNISCKIVKDRHKVSLPLRVNFAGGWTDTPPYCLENVGKVLNAPILLEGNRPVEVYIEKIKQKAIILESTDIDEKYEFSDINDYKILKILLSLFHYKKHAY